MNRHQVDSEKSRDVIKGTLGANPSKKRPAIGSTVREELVDCPSDSNKSVMGLSCVFGILRGFIVAMEQVFGFEGIRQLGIAGPGSKPCATRQITDFPNEALQGVVAA
jgi:hypothetical protein